MAVGIGVVTLWQTRPRWPLIQRALILVLLTIVLAAPTTPDYFAGFNYRYSLPLTTLGLFRFVPLSDIVGLTLFRLREAPEPLSPLLWLAAMSLAGFASYGLLAGPQRGRWLGLLAGAGGFLLYLRFGAEYHYGYLKAAAYMAWLAGALAASGLQAALDHLRARPQWLRRLVAVSVTGVIGGAVAFTGGRVVADHWGQPGLFANELPARRELRRLVPASSTVWLTGDPRVQGVTSGLAAYLLAHAVVWGDVRTGYASSSAGEPDAVADYALLQRDADPTPWGYADPPIWSGGSYRLYRRPEGLLAHLRLEQVVDGAQSVTIPVSANRLSSATPSPNQEQATRWIQLQTVTLTPAALIIDGRLTWRRQVSAQSRLGC